MKDLRTCYRKLKKTKLILLLVKIKLSKIIFLVKVSLEFRVSSFGGFFGYLSNVQRVLQTVSYKITFRFECDLSPRSEKLHVCEHMAQCSFQ